MAIEASWCAAVRVLMGAVLIPDFTRVRTLIAALEDPEKRSQEVYQQGQWERGGYLRGAYSPLDSRDDMLITRRPHALPGWF